MMRKVDQGPFDIWIQAASGGEALLATMIVKCLTENLSETKGLRILITSGTRQGVETLRTIHGNNPSDQLKIHTAFFPFDAPFLMHKAFQLYAPLIAVIIETELWPGFLVAAKKTNTPVLLVNGRMSEKSYRSYKLLSTFFKKYGPDRVLAISEADKNRFNNITGEKRTELMNNIKFDRIKPIIHDSENSNAAIISEKNPFVVLGSVRRQEEEKLLATIKQLFEKKPEIVLGLFPKHMERTTPWMKRLKKANIPTVKRSLTDRCCSGGTVIIWDRFGELSSAYNLAGAAFVGGSLVDLGGQNFLEPLLSGLKPVTGPYLKNFAWVDKSLFSSGLATQAADEHELAKQLLYNLDHPENRDTVIAQAESFFAPRKGGTRQVCQAIMETLSTVKKT